MAQHAEESYLAEYIRGIKSELEMLDSSLSETENSVVNLMERVDSTISGHLKTSEANENDDLQLKWLDIETEKNEIKEKLQEDMHKKEDEIQKSNGVEEIDRLTQLPDNQSNGVEEIDRLTQLPDNVLLSIMCLLTTKEAAQLSVVSPEWKKLWAYFPGILNFEDPMTLYERRTLIGKVLLTKNTKELVRIDTHKFVRWVTCVVEQHVGPSLEEFRVAFDLDNTYQSDIDKWVVFALSKGVSSIKLEFNANAIIDIEHDLYSIPLECCAALKSPHRLKTLVLTHMEITAQVLECFLNSCPFLENLRMCKISSLGSIRSASNSPLALKHFDVSHCHLEIIDILAPKLITFRYHGCNIELQIRNALLLNEVSLGSDTEQPTHALQSISGYLPQLEYLHIWSDMSSWGRTILVSPPPVSKSTNLKHLKLTIKGISEDNLIEWMTLIEDFPVLQKLTLELDVFDAERDVTLEKRTSPPKPLKCLRRLEVYGFGGFETDIELVRHVIENAVALEDVLIDLRGYTTYDAELQEKRAEAMFKKKLPIGAKFVINNRYQEHNYMYSYPMVESYNYFHKPVRGMLGRLAPYIYGQEPGQSTKLGGALFHKPSRGRIQ